MESSANNMIEEMLQSQSFTVFTPRLLDELQEIRSPITSSSKYGDPLPVLSPSIWLSAVTHLEGIINPIERILPFYNMGYRYLIAQDKDDTMNIEYMLERIESPLRWKAIVVSYLDNIEMPPISYDIDCRERQLQQASTIELNGMERNDSERNDLEKNDSEKSGEENDCTFCLEKTTYNCDECNEPLCEQCASKDGLCSLCNRYYTQYSSEYYSG